MDDYNTAGDKPRDRSTNRHTITGDPRHDTGIDWQRAREVLGE